MQKRTFVDMPMNDALEYHQRKQRAEPVLSEQVAREKESFLIIALLYEENENEK
jgi:hypothetical protein